MTANHEDQLDQIVLGMSLSEMQRLPVWVDALAAQYDIADNVTFAINLCLEEAVSNVIRHGYSDGAASEVTVQFSSPKEQCFVFVIDDDAPLCDPLALAPLPSIRDQDPVRLGGQGIRLMREFADSLEYEATAKGNRLRIGFGPRRG